MQGYRTILANLVALGAVWLNEHYQIVVTPDTQVAMVTTLITVGNIALRCLTKTPVFQKWEQQNVQGYKAQDCKSN